jgi:hypothetical protein
MRRGGVNEHCTYPADCRASLAASIGSWTVAPVDAARALEPKITASGEPAGLSLYEASHLALAVATARDNERGEAHEHLDTARKTAEDHDYGNELGSRCRNRAAQPVQRRFGLCVNPEGPNSSKTKGISC